MYVYLQLLQMSGQTDLSLEEFEQEGYNFEELEAIAGDDNKVEFLRILSTSEQLIEWLQMETKGIRCLHMCTLILLVFLQMLVSYIIWLDYQ